MTKERKSATFHVSQGSNGPSASLPSSDNLSHCCDQTPSPALPFSEYCLVSHSLNISARRARLQERHRHHGRALRDFPPLRNHGMAPNASPTIQLNGRHMLTVARSEYAKPPIISTPRTIKLNRPPRCSQSPAPPSRKSDTCKTEARGRDIR